jgi:hypothetical protein
MAKSLDHDRQERRPKDQAFKKFAVEFQLNGCDRNVPGIPAFVDVVIWRAGIRYIRTELCIVQTRGMETVKGCHKRGRRRPTVPYRQARADVSATNTPNAR